MKNTLLSKHLKTPYNASNTKQAPNNVQAKKQGQSGSQQPSTPLTAVFSDNPIYRYFSKKRIQKPTKETQNPNKHKKSISVGKADIREQPLASPTIPLKGNTTKNKHNKRNKSTTPIEQFSGIYKDYSAIH